jgi:2-phospho-L-lactate guanylyltransferase
MQGTVKEFSEETRTGAVILDDGTEIPVPPEAFSSSGLLKLQFGQRVRFEVEGEGPDRRVTRITIATLY